jgi:hypothetical protein
VPPFGVATGPLDLGAGDDGADEVCPWGRDGGGLVIRGAGVTGADGRGGGGGGGGGGR